MKCSCQEFKCKLHKCCNSCTFYVFERATTKERCKSQRRFRKQPNKACEKCFFCKSVSFCPSCDKCPQCCRRSACGGSTEQFLASLGPEGFKSKSCIYPEGGVQPPIHSQTSSYQYPSDKERYANPSRDSYLREALLSLLQKRAVEKVRVQSSLGFYNRLFIVPKPNQKWRLILDLSALNRFLKVKTFKMETPESIRLSLQPGEWVTSLDFSDAYFHIPISPNSRKFLRFSFHNQTFQFRALPFGLSTAPMEFTIVVKEDKLMAQARNIRMHQYLDDWLIRAKDRDTCVQDTQTLLALCQELGWVVNLSKSELEPKQIFNFVGYQYDLVQGVVRPTPERWEALNSKISSLLERTSRLVRELMSLIGLLTATEKQVTSGRLHMRPIQCHQKNDWHIPESLEKVIPIPRSLHPHLLWWVKEENVLSGQHLHPLRHAVQIFTDASNEGWGAHLGDYTARGGWSVPESKLHINFLELKVVLLALKAFEPFCRGRVVLVATDNTTVVAYINKEGGMPSGSLCPPVEASVLVQPQGNLPKSTSHSGPAQCDSRQTVPAPSHSDGKVPSSGSFHSDLSQMAPSQTRPVCDQIQLQATPVRVPSPRPQGVGRGCLKPILGGSRPVCFSSSSSVDKCPDQSSQSSLQEDDNSSSGLAQHALVLGPGGDILPNPGVSSQSPRSPDSAVQRQPSQGSPKSEPSCLAPRAKNIREQGFSDQVAKGVEAPQRRSTISVYEAKWAVFVRWCKAYKVDFRSPSVEQIADFLLHLFQDKKLQPSTIDGYRSAIADKVGNFTVNISKNENLNRLPDSFHRDRPKGHWGVPSWNLSLVLHQLTKPPFEPLRKASLKHLTFKTMFLLALGSGKRRSEIHAWVNRNIRHQSD